jgi:DNA-binding transcriptional LysR family regulator
MAGPDLNLLVALDTLLAEGSVVAAARRLGLSASAMSRTLTRLRVATGDPLLVRAGRSLVPTPRAAELRETVGALTRQVSAILTPSTTDLDLTTLERTFTVRANDAFVELIAASLISAAAVAPGVRLRFAPKPDKDVRPLRDGEVDLDVGVLGETGPEVRIQTLYRDGFVGAVRNGHPLLAKPITAERYAHSSHIVASRRGRTAGPVDEALQALSLTRCVVAVVPNFSAALAAAACSDLVALAPASFVAMGPYAARLSAFSLPVPTAEIAVSQMWHPRLDGDPAHRWLRSLVWDVTSTLRARNAP